MSEESGPDWLGLLKWSLAHTDGTNQSEYSAMTEEDRKFLEAVMTEGVKNEPTRMKEIMNSLTKSMDDSTTIDEDIALDELEELRDIVGQIDMAQVFMKLGGLTCLLELIDFAPFPPEVRSLGASVLATIAQNNPTVQEIMHSKDIVTRLVRTFHREESHSICAKVLYAISCIIRNYDIAEENFCSKFADDVFNAAIQSKQPILLRRVFFLANALLLSDSSSTSRQEAILSIIIPSCYEFITCADTEVREGILTLIVSIASFPLGHQTLRVQRSQIDDYLRRLREISSDDDEAQVLQLDSQLTSLLDNLAPASDAQPIAQSNRQSPGVLLIEGPSSTDQI